MFKANGVPEAFGFVNAGKIAGTADGEAVLDAWRAAGYPLGNHTYSHMNLANAPSLDAWIADCLLYTSPSPRDLSTSRMPSSA